MEEVTDYNAIVTRSEPGWSIYVPEIDRHTYAAHLREIEEMARDLVQVMTDLPIEGITVAIHLPDDLAGAIAAMRRAREGVTAAEAAARDTQQAAAMALRDAGAPLRDIAAALGVSHQRVHQILEEAARQLEHFRGEVALNLESGALKDFALPVADDKGGTPIVVALANEGEGAATLSLRQGAAQPDPAALLQPHQLVGQPVAARHLHIRVADTQVPPRMPGEVERHDDGR